MDIIIILLFLFLILVLCVTLPKRNNIEHFGSLAPGSACTSDSQCKNTAKCANGNCLITVNNTGCITDSNCYNSVCNTRTTPTKCINMQSLKYNEPCSDSNQCKSSYICSNSNFRCVVSTGYPCIDGNGVALTCASNLCNTALSIPICVDAQSVPVSGSCSNNLMCNTNAECTGNICKLKFGRMCSLDNDCISGFCDPLSNPSVCNTEHSVVPGAACAIDRNCVSDVCINNKCVSKGYAGYDCSVDKMCYYGSCDINFTPPICVDDKSMISGNICSNSIQCTLGSCNTKLTPSICVNDNTMVYGNACSNNNQCVIGTECTNNICKISNGSICNANGNCSSNYCNTALDIPICINAYSVVTGNKCAQSENCANDGVCSNTICKIKNGRDCTSDNDCSSNNCNISLNTPVCIKNNTVSYGGTCTNTRDCILTGICNNNICKHQNGDKCIIERPEMCNSGFCNSTGCADLNSALLNESCINDSACIKDTSCNSSRLCKNNVKISCNTNDDCITNYCDKKVCATPAPTPAPTQAPAILYKKK